MKKICLQAGHLNVVTGQTGAPGEQSFNKVTCEALSKELIKKGFSVTVTDAFADQRQDITDTDWDLFLAVHADMDYPNDAGSGFVDFPDPSVDKASSKSKKIKEAIESVYFDITKIKNVSHSNPNTKFYYMWEALSAKTPCVIIECGQRQDAHDKPILENTQIIVTALAAGICKAFGVEYTLPDTMEDLERQLNAMRESRNEWKQEVKDLRKDLEGYENLKKKHQEILAELEQASKDLDKARQERDLCAKEKDRLDKENAKKITQLNEELSYAVNENVRLHQEIKKLTKPIEEVSKASSEVITLWEKIKRLMGGASK